MTALRDPSTIHTVEEAGAAFTALAAQFTQQKHGPNNALAEEGLMLYGALLCNHLRQDEALAAAVAKTLDELKHQAVKRTDWDGATYLRKMERLIQDDMKIKFE